MGGNLRMDLDVAVSQQASVEDIRLDPIDGIRTVGGRTFAAHLSCQCLDIGALEDPDPVLVVRPGLAVIFHLDPEGHRFRLLVAGLAPEACAREASEICRRSARLRPASSARIAELAVEPAAAAAVLAGFATALQAVEVYGLEAALLLLAGMHPITLDARLAANRIAILIELTAAAVLWIKAADASARSSDLAAAGGMDGRIHLPVGRAVVVSITADVPAGSDAATD